MPDDMEAEDTHQIAWMRTFGKLNLWVQKGPLRAWLRRLFVNVCISVYQKQKRQKQWLGPLPDQETMEVMDPTPLADFAAQEHLLKLVAALPAGARLVFNLYAVDGYTHAEIAAILDISEGNSRQQLLRARTRLAQQINGIGLPKGNPEPAIITSLPS